MSRIDVDRLAQRLDQAWTQRTTIPPPGAAGELTSVEDAYAVQQAWARRRIAAGDTRVGRKIGLTSPGMQRQMGVAEPDFGDLWESRRFAGPVVAIEHFIQPRVEGEVAFVLAKDIDPADEADITIELVRDAVEVALPALEIVDSRIADWAIGFTDTVADNASSGLFVVGADGLSLDDIEPVDVTMSLTINGEERSSGNGAACLGDPLEALRWLAVQAYRFGDPLRAGHLILSGALGPFVPFAPGDRVVATISGFAPLSVTFEE